jgi:MFS family permease
MNCGVRGPAMPLLGLLTVVAYGSWFYGFGVLLDDIARDLGSGLGVLTGGYALAQVLTGVLGLVAGRTLDRRGARIPFAVGAVAGPGIFAAATLTSHPLAFAFLFGLGGGVIGATGFYHLTQSVVARLAVGAEAAAIARLTIWGAFASPVMIPLTEASRALVGWRWTMRATAVILAGVLAAAAWAVQRSGPTASASSSARSSVAVRVAWSDPAVRRLAMSALAGSFGASVLVVLQVPAMVANGLPRSTAAALAGARGFAQLLGRLPLARLLRRVPTKEALVGAKVLTAVGALLLAVSTSVPIAVLFVLVAGAGIGATSPLEGIYAREVLPPGDFGVLMGSLHLLLGFAAGGGPLIAALVVDVSGVAWSGLVLAAGASFLSAAVLAGMSVPGRARR